MCGAPVRDEFSKSVRDTLAKRVGVRCSNPSCRKLTTGPRSDARRIICIGVAAHITAAAPGGMRYAAKLSSEERSSESNGIWLCQNCAKLIDNDDIRYSAEKLRAWKSNAEHAALSEIEGATRLAEDAAELRLFVGGVALGDGRPPRHSNLTFDSTGTCIRHDYELCVNVCNLGNAPLTGYHVDLEFPARALERPERNPGYIARRSTRRQAFFRASGAAAPELFPGDEETVIRLPYYVDDEMFWNHGGASENPFSELLRTTLYRSELPPIAVEACSRRFKTSEVLATARVVLTAVGGGEFANDREGWILTMTGTRAPLGSGLSCTVPQGRSLQTHAVIRWCQCRASTAN